MEVALGENGSRFVLRGENSIQLYGRKDEKINMLQLKINMCRLACLNVVSLSGLLGKSLEEFLPVVDLHNLVC